MKKTICKTSNFENSMGRKLRYVEVVTELYLINYADGRLENKQTLLLKK